MAFRSILPLLVIAAYHIDPQNIHIYFPERLIKINVMFTRPIRKSVRVTYRRNVGYKIANQIHIHNIRIILHQSSLKNTKKRAQYSPKPSLFTVMYYYYFQNLNPTYSTDTMPNMLVYTTQSLCVYGEGKRKYGIF